MRLSKTFDGDGTKVNDAQKNAKKKEKKKKGGSEGM
jgi:hypothetical protein